MTLKPLPEESQKLKSLIQGFLQTSKPLDAREAINSELKNLKSAPCDHTVYPECLNWSYKVYYAIKVLKKFDEFQVLTHQLYDNL